MEPKVAFKAGKGHPTCNHPHMYCNHLSIYVPWPSILMLCIHLCLHHGLFWTLIIPCVQGPSAPSRAPPFHHAGLNISLPLKPREKYSGTTQLAGTWVSYFEHSLLEPNSARTDGGTGGLQLSILVNSNSWLVFQLLNLQGPQGKNIIKK